MQITGIICEYNPFHLGHRKQLDTVRALFGPDSGIVCLMSGNFVQRGAPAIVDKTHRAQAAIVCGADLVLELPVTCSLSSAEGFASGGVSILGSFCGNLCFGAETADKDKLLHTARALLSQDFSPALRQHLNMGMSFPAARQAALETMELDAQVLTRPNDILAVEYCKAILSQGVPMSPLPILRGGDYHAASADEENPSATAVRKLMLESGLWLDYIPAEARECLRRANIHTWQAGERAVLARLRTMTEDDFAALPYGSEGMWRKLMHAARSEATIAAVTASVKSKRYTRTRIDRMLLCAFLGLTQQDLDTPAPYARVLAFNDRGREILKTARRSGSFPNIGERIDHPYQQIEDRCGDLYGLFALSSPEPPGAQARARVFYHPAHADEQPHIIS